MSIFYIETQMKELREQLSHSKRIGCFFGAGTSMAMGLPGIVSLTEQAIEKLEGDDNSGAANGVIKSISPTGLSNQDIDCNTTAKRKKRKYLFGLNGRDKRKSSITNF